MRDFIAALCTTMTRARRRVRHCAFPPIHVRPKDDDDENDGDLLFRLYRWRVLRTTLRRRVPRVCTPLNTRSLSLSLLRESPRGETAGSGCSV